MVSRPATILIVILLVTNAYAQDKPPREETGQPNSVATGAPAGPCAPAVPLPSNLHQDGCYVYESPVHPGFKTGCCKVGCNCNGKCGHCVSEVVHWLFYRPIPIPNQCRHCKHYLGGCTPDVMDFFVQRYGYYNWRADCAPAGVAH